MNYSMSPGATETDSALWRRTVEGDPDAFGELYTRHAGRIYNYLARRLGDPGEAEELTASVFLEAYRRRDAVTIEEGKVVAWLFGIATNLAALRRLPREQQEVVALCLWSGLSYEEAAVALSIPVGTVRSRL